MVVPDIFGHPLEQLSFAEDKDEVQTLAAQTAQETFAKRIGTRGRNGRVKDFNPRTDRDPVESRAIFAVIVADEKAGPSPKGVAARSCCASQTSPGWRVTATCTTRREDISIVTNTKMSRNQKSCA